MTDLRRLAEAATADNFLDPGVATLTGAAFGAWEAELANFQDQCPPEVILALLDIAGAARAYLDWRARRLAQWQAVVDCGHEDNNCPEMLVIRSEPFDMDVTMDAAIAAALDRLAEVQR